MKKLLVAGALAASFSASPAFAAETIFFSDFEGESPGRNSGFTVVDTSGVWTREAGTAGIELQFGSTGGATADPGNNRVKVELDSFSNSGMFYTFAESGVYTLDFLFSPRPNVGPGSNGIRLFLPDGSGQLFTGGPLPTTSWTNESVGPFTAFANQTLLFSAEGTSDSLGGYLDDIRLDRIGAVPEPGTWALFILGLGLVGSSLRRRQTATARVAFA
ncbi:MAG: PEPxxWA-CTERM sorting domain-containing protein [Pseudomonadota bacterium]